MGIVDAEIKTPLSAVNPELLTLWRLFVSDDAELSSTLDAVRLKTFNGLSNFHFDWRQLH